MTPPLLELVTTVATREQAQAQALALAAVAPATAAYAAWVAEQVDDAPSA